jgi:hypothetical protein
MRRLLKHPDSAILRANLKYKKGDASNNKKIADILFKEQKGFCAYTEEPLTVTDKDEIEHFNPELKYKDADGYNNWFLVKAEWNIRKGGIPRWLDFQPVLHPTNENFEERVLYFDGDYIVASETDIEAVKLIGLLHLDDPHLAKIRKQYISRTTDNMRLRGEDAKTFYEILLTANPIDIKYLRAIKEEFDVDVWAMLP